MRSTFAGLALVALTAAKPVPQSSGSCSSDYDGEFKIQVIKAGDKVKRQEDDTALVMTLSGGKLMDDQGRTGYIASNMQFQFDSPPQKNAQQTGDFAVCGDMLAHSGETTWDQCLSGDFYNLYSENNGGQCEEINIQVIGSGASPSGGASQIPDGQVTGSAVSSQPPVTQISDGQIQASTALSAPVTQISDGQIQATTATPVAPVTQISDGQLQAPTSTAVAPVTQISDGQIQAPTSTAAPAPSCTQIVDGTKFDPARCLKSLANYLPGQPQCPVASTGSIPYPGANSTVIGAQPSASVVPATGAASSFNIGSSVAGLVAAVAALAMF
ncbi:uncharacterized protein LTR77_000333 [Saxophila tyrrhenica]|uniref:Cell wall mannoprotein PIR1-like C-terminal domain-containing protein n=1 Tax=Saxophila tyrrhenica TaxID=1690608 RepID=A0AAV9PMI5_9PEZI|nr:hypothetical protein LTR77_000333 [Saxophila tyrrhenica]